MAKLINPLSELPHSSNDEILLSKGITFYKDMR